jgi:hypothetical protein
MERRLRAPSPALVISLIALFVALGGSAYAATRLPKNSVGTKQLKKNAVTGPKIKSGAVTAAKINTRGLTVPSAVHATAADSAASATNATNAGTVGGVTVKGFSYQTPSNGATATLFTLDGLTLTATCSAGRVDATTTVDHAYISASWVTATNVAQYVSNTDFDVASGSFLVNSTTGAETGSIEYVQPNGKRVSVILQADMATACTLSGSAFASG